MQELTLLNYQNVVGSSSSSSSSSRLSGGKIAGAVIGSVVGALLLCLLLYLLATRSGRGTTKFSGTNGRTAAEERDMEMGNGVAPTRLD